MASNAATAEGELRQCIVQVCARDYPLAAEWVPSNEDELYSAIFLIDEKLPAGNYALLQLATLGNVYSTHSLAVGLCGVTTEKIVQELEDEEQFIFLVSIAF